MNNLYKLLIVDDEEIIRFSFKKLFNWTKHNIDLVHECSNGKEALDYLTNNEVDILITDIKMPIMDGLEATREIRKENKDIAIIALTANAFDSDKQKSADAGCNDYMTKPIIATELLDLLNKYIG